MSWLDKKIEEHNAKITYVDWEEAWNKTDWLAGIILWFIVGIAVIVFGCFKFCVPLIIFGIVVILFSVVWHFWHLLYY